MAGREGPCNTWLFSLHSLTFGKLAVMCLMTVAMETPDSMK